MRYTKEHEHNTQDTDEPNHWGDEKHHTTNTTVPTCAKREKEKEKEKERGRGRGRKERRFATAILLAEQKETK
jgi:hypothetical protein